MAAERRPRLEGKVALITGAGSGIARASAILFAEEGARVACADLAPDSAEETASRIRADGGEAFVVQADVRRAAEAERMVAAVVDRFGQLDVLFNVVGGGPPGRVHELDEAVWDQVLDMTLKTVYQCSRAALPQFLAQGHGTIVNTASNLAQFAYPAFPAYCTAKAGVVMLTKQMALDYGPTVRVNCICPGATDTPLLRRSIGLAPDPVARERHLAEMNGVMKRLAQPREIAYAALFLASDEASFVTGHALVADGGHVGLG